jgi:hypothetical protein
VLLKSEGPADRAIRLSQGFCSLPVPCPAEGLQGSVAGLVVVAAASSLLVTGATGRCLPHIPFGISAVRAQVQPPIDRSRQAG